MLYMKNNKKIFLVADESTLSGIQYLNIQDGTQKIPHVSYWHDCQPTSCAPNRNSIAQVVDDTVRSPGINENSFCLLLSDAAKYSIWRLQVQY